MRPELKTKSSGGRKDFEKMYEERRQVRNSDGNLICDLIFIDGVWSVTIKRRGCYTTMSLMVDGAVYIEENDGPPEKMFAVSYS